MANVLALALKINADATGLTNNLGPAERAFQKLGDQAGRITGLFDEFAESSEAAATAQAETAAALDDLLARVQRGEVTAKEFAEQFAAIGIAARDEADALREAARITEANLSPLERFTREQTKLKAQLDAGRISQETFNRAIASAAKPLSDAERAAAGFAEAADDIGGAADGLGSFGQLVGNLPTPLGNVSGKISDFAKAGRQLTALFSGGLTSGLSQLGTAAASLVNPFTLAAAGVVAFNEAARSITSGLIDLENRVEALGNQAFQLGVSFEFVQVLDETARRSGTSVDALRGATTRLQQQLVEAGNGSATAVAAIEGLGVSYQQLAALNPDQQFIAIARAITEIADPAERTAAATRLFGEAGVQLLPFFRNLGPAADDIERVGRSLTEVDKAGIDAFGQSVDALVVAVGGLGQTLLLPFVELATSVTEGFTEVSAAITSIVEPLSRTLAPAFAQIGRVIREVLEVVATSVRVFGFFAQALEPIGRFLLPAIVASLVRINAASIVGGITALSRGFVAAAAAARTYAATASAASISTAALAASVRALLSSTGIGVAVVAFGLAAEALIGWFTTAEETVDEIDKVGDASDGASSEVERLSERLSSLRVNPNLADDYRRTLEEVNQTFKEAFREAADFAAESTALGNASRDAANDFARSIRQLNELRRNGQITEEQYVRFARQTTAAYEEQIEVVREQAREAERRAESEKRAVDSLVANYERANRVAREFGGSEERARAAENLQKLDAEYQRVEEQLQEARKKGAQDEIAALEQRLELVNAAALRENDIASGRAAAREAELKRVEEANALRERLDKEAQNRRLAEAKQAEQEIANERQRVNALVDEQLALAAFDGDSQRLAASRNAQAIQAEIARVEREIAAARDAGNQAAVDAGTARVAQLDQIAAKERDIASGRAQAEEEIARLREQQLQEQQRQQEQFVQAQQRQAEQAQQARERQQQELQKAFEEQAKEQERIFELNRQLATPSSQAAQGTDIRTTQGANAFIQAIQGGFDPQYAVALEQLKVQRQIAVGITQNLRALGLPAVTFGPLGAA